MMNLTKLPLYLLLIIISFAACGDDNGMEEEMTDLDCLLTRVSLKLSATSSLGLMSVSYEDGKVSEAGLQTYKFTYNSDGRVFTSLLESSPGVPRVETTFTYNGDKIANAAQVWGDDPLAEPRYTYDFSYDGDYIDKVSVGGQLGTSELDFDFDTNGNVLRFVDWIFEDVTTYTYDASNLGLFSDPLPHADAVAYSIATGTQFWFWNNALNTVEESGEMYTFSNKYNDQGLMIEALTGDESFDYLIDYECK